MDDDRILDITQRIWELSDVRPTHQRLGVPFQVWDRAQSSQGITNWDRLRGYQDREHVNEVAESNTYLIFSLIFFVSLAKMINYFVI